MPVRIFSSIPSPVKITWNMQTLYRYLWGTLAFPVETNCPHLERQPPFYTTVGHVPVPGEFHEGRLVPAMPLNSLSLRDFPLSGGHRLHYIPAGGSTAAIFKENLADVPPRRLMPPSLMWIPSANNIADVDFANVKPLNPTQLLLSAPSGLLCLSSPVAYNSKLSPAKVSQPQLLSTQ